MRLVLFDIDGTLLLTAGAGMRAFHRAIRRIFDIPADSFVVNPDGKTDPLIAREFLAHYGMEALWRPPRCEALFDAYLSELEVEMELAHNNGAVQVLPGVIDLLTALSSRSEFALGLVTGNLERGARIKLGKAGLDHYFHFGGYGSDDENRTVLIKAGIERGVAFAAPAMVEEIFVVGDTPLDIIHGHAAGARVIAVAAARYSMPDLAAHQPDLLVPDLRDADRILPFLEGGF
jgi:phosphoglycolate phosphatase